MQDGQAYQVEKKGRLKGSQVKRSLMAEALNACQSGHLVASSTELCN